MKTKPWLGKIVKGTVDHVADHYAFLKIDELPVTPRAYLHVSQVAEERISSLKTLIDVGDKIDVLITKFNRRKECWEVSNRLVEVKENSHESLEIGQIKKARVTRLSPENILLKIDGYPASIGHSESDLIYRAKILTVGTELDVKITGYNPDFFGFTCSRSGAIEFPEGTQEIMQVLDIERETKNYKRKSKIEWNVIGCTKQGILVSVKFEFIANLEERVKPGDFCRIEITGKGKQIKWLHWGKLLYPYPDNSIYANKPTIGEKRLCVVKSVVGYGAFVCVWDGSDDFIHRTDIISDDQPNLNQHLLAGDNLEVEICESKDTDRPYALKFLRLIENDNFDFQNDPGHKSLFDLHSLKANSTDRGGFLRSGKFKNETLSLFAHKCVVCGKNQSIGSQYTAAEAAHIIPRSKRGLDETSNAMCLCKAHHWAFDRGLITISEDREVLVSEVLSNKVSDFAVELLSYDSSEIYWPDKLEFPSEKFLWHRRNIFLER